MKLGEKLQVELERLGYYISSLGGAPSPHMIPDGKLAVEWISDGIVMDPESGHPSGAGSIFVHQPGHHTVYRSPKDKHYECMVGFFKVTGDIPDFSRRIMWDDSHASASFAKEVVHSHHRVGVGLDILGSLIWSRLCVVAERSRLEKHSPKVPERIGRCISFMEERYSETFSIEDLATSVGLSVSHLHSRFREYTGKSPHQFLIQVRMKAARHLLVTTNMPIKAIALEVGYANTENFCRAFKKETDLTAAAFRGQYSVFFYKKW